MRVVTLPLIASLLLLQACAGRDAQPITASQDGDAVLSCVDLRNEIALNNEEMLGLLSERDGDVAQNVVSAAAGVVFIVPFFFMDLKGAAANEINALERRNQVLAKRYSLKSCEPALDQKELTVDNWPSIEATEE